MTIPVRMSDQDLMALFELITPTATKTPETGCRRPCWAT